MLKKTHEAFGGAFWLGTTAVVNAIAIKLGHDPILSPASVIAGLPFAVAHSAGKNSPDIDFMWAPGPPHHNYNWKYHRGITHRFWFAIWVITLPLVLLTVLYVSAELPLYRYLWPVVLSPAVGWFSHLFGDMIFGRLLVLGHKVGLGWETGGIAETGRSEHYRLRLAIDPAAKIFAASSVLLAITHVILYLMPKTLGL